MVKSATELKQSITPERVEAARKLFVAMAWVKTVKPVVVAYEKEILAKHQWHVAEEWHKHGGDKIILDPDLSYLLSDAVSCVCSIIPLYTIIYKIARGFCTYAHNYPL